MSAKLLLLPTPTEPKSVIIPEQVTTDQLLRLTGKTLPPAWYRRIDVRPGDFIYFLTASAFDTYREGFRGVVPVWARSRF